MRVTSLKLRRFLAWSELDLILSAPVSVFVGPNGAGKSSILDAVRVVLSRTARGMPKGNLAPLTTWGKKPFRVEAVVGITDDEGDFVGSRIRRTASSLAAIDDDGTAIKLTEGQLVEALTCHPKALEAVFDVWKALRMTPEERRTLILDLAGDHVPEVTVDLLKDWGLVEPGIAQFALGGRWKKAASVAAEFRRATQANHDAIDLSPPDDFNIGGGDGIPASQVDDGILADQRRILDELRSERSALDQRIGAAQAAPNGSAKRTRLAQIENELDEHEPADELTAQAAELTCDLDALQEDLATAAAVMAKACDCHDEAFHEAKKLSEDLGRAEKLGQRHACPDCGLEHQAEEAPAEDVLKALEAKCAKADELLDEANADSEAAAEDVKGTTAALTRLSKSLGDVTVSLSCLESLEKERVAITKALKEDDAKPGVEDLVEERDQLEERIKKGESMVWVTEEYQVKVKIHEERLKKAARLVQRIKDLGAQEDLCRPDKEGNIPTRLLADTLGPIRERLARWTGSALWTSELERHGFGLQINGVDLDDDFSPQVVDTAGGRHAIGTINAGAEWRVGFALAAALADLSGLRFLALDEVTYLDADNRGGLIAALLECRDDFDQVLICAVKSGEVIQPPTEDVQIFYLDGAVAEPLAPGEVRE